MKRVDGRYIERFRVWQEFYKFVSEPPRFKQPIANNITQNLYKEIQKEIRFSISPKLRVDSVVTNYMLNSLSYKQLLRHMNKSQMGLTT